MPQSAVSGTISGRLALIEEFALLIGGRQLFVPHVGERVLTYLALAHRPVARIRLAGALWPESTDQSASKSLRTALWRLRQVHPELVEIAGERVSLDRDVAVDLAQLSAIAERLLSTPDGAALDQVQLLIDHVELLPDWDEDWVAASRERYRLTRSAALESAACALLDRGQADKALIVALAVVDAEPLRESARRIVMRAHLAQGNTVDAIREHDRFRRLLRTEFGLEPSRQMTEMLCHCGVRHRDGVVTMEWPADGAERQHSLRGHGQGTSPGGGHPGRDS